MKTNNLRLLLGICLISFCSQSLIAQTDTITGQLIDKDREPITMVNVAILKSDSSFVAGGVSRADGSFSIPVPRAANYIARFTYIGYAVKNFAIPSASVNLGLIALEPDPRVLKDVTINSLRPSITQLADRMVVSVQGTALAAGSTAYDVLARSPGVFIDADGNIQLNGRSGVTVMLDGKLTYLSANDLRTLLISTSAENIKNIEIITNPSAKYDAEGTSGILNINMKKNVLRGINGSVYAGYLTNFHMSGYSAGGNINHRSGKWSSFLSTDLNRWVGGREATFTRVFFAPQKTTYFDQTATGRYYTEGPPRLRLGTDYSINSNHSVGFMVSYNTNTLHQNFLTDTYIGLAPRDPEMYIDANNYNSNTHKNFTSNLRYSGKLDTSGTTLSADLDYVNIRNRGEANFYNYYDSLKGNGPVLQDFLYTRTPNGFDIYSAKVDFSTTMGKSSKFETGLKTSYVVSDNDSKFYFNNGGLVDDPRRSNHFNYKENIYAAYVNGSGNLGKKFTLQAGLRMEHTDNVGTQITTGQVTKRNYTDLFPSVFFQHKVSPNYNVTYSYTRRISRPNYGSLNPFRAYRDPYTYIEGNPFLRPQYGDVFTLSQTFKKLYILNFTYLVNKDYISELPTLNVDSATTVYYSGNVNNNYNYVMSAIAPIRIAKFWDIQNTLTISYNEYSIFESGKIQENKAFFYQLQSAQIIQLPKKIRLEVNSLFRGPGVSGLYKMAALWRVDLGIKKSFYNKKFDLSVSVNDVFKTHRLLFRTRINDNINDFDQYLHMRNIGVTLRYNFSKGLKVEQKSIKTVDEAGRAN